MLKVGVIGYGYWGPKIVRNFSYHQDCKVVAVCDKNPAALDRVSIQHPNLRLMTDADDIVTSSEIDAVAIVTEWNEFRNMDLARLRKLMRRPVLCDLRNIYDPEDVQAAGMRYVGVGRGRV